jgi:hypothetical protein
VGTHTLWVAADNWNYVSESNESNNWSSVSFTVAAPPTVNISLNDPNHLSQDAALIADTQAAATDWIKAALGLSWGSRISSQAALDIMINVLPTTRANASYQYDVSVGSDGSRTVYEAGTLSELLTGTDPNGTSPDIVINVDPTYLQNTLWLDPDPSHPSSIPSDRTDAISVLRHEIGHGLGILSDRDLTTGSLPASYETRWDQLIQIHSDGSAWFSGTNAESAYGGPVPITTLRNGEQYSHLGNGNDAASSDLMNGVTFYEGTSYNISALDLAILSDLAAPLFPNQTVAASAPPTVSDGIVPVPFARTSAVSQAANVALLGSYMASTFAGPSGDAGSISHIEHPAQTTQSPLLAQPLAFPTA